MQAARWGAVELQNYMEAMSSQGKAVPPVTCSLVPDQQPCAMERKGATHAKAHAGSSYILSLVGCLLVQAISQVRTVFSFAAENRTVQEYMKALEVTLQLGIQVKARS